jgi:RHS repeat-associated protein
LRAVAAQELAFQLTDAQFSVIAVATPGKPGVVIDRIAYSPYGEATRTLRSDVNGDGFVNKDDYAGIIKPRTGAAIGTAAYVVEADLDRDGKITQTDYDICIADDGKSSSGGVGEAGLFSRGVRNSIGYCGYVFNEDSGLYTVRFRTYSPTLGRWLERDPAGYVDGMGLYEYVRGGPIAGVDPWGLVDGRKHHAVCLGLGGSPDQLCIDLGETDPHLKAHDFLRKRLGGGSWDKQRAVFAKLTDEERRELIRGSLVAAGVKKDVLTDDVLDGMFYDFQPGVSRERGPIRHMIDVDGNLVLCGAKPGSDRVVRAKGSGGFAAVLVLGVLGIHTSTSNATDRLLTDTGCQQILKQLQEAMRHKGDQCLYCEHILSIEDRWIVQCGIEISAVASDIVGNTGGAVAWNSWHEDWKKLREDCKTLVNTVRSGGIVGGCAGGIGGGAAK